MSKPGIRRGFAYRLGSELCSKALALAVNIGLLRGLGPEEWGRMQWALALAALAAAAADFGLGSLFLRELSKARSAERVAWIKAAWALKALLWVLVLLGVGLLGLALPVEQRVLLFCAVAYTAALSLTELNGFAFAGLERLDLDFWVSLASKAAQAAAALIALALGHTALGVLAVMALAGAGGWIWGLLRLRGALAQGRKPWRPLAKRLAALLWPFGLVPLFALAMAKADNLILERLQGLAALGIYQAAYKWIEAVAFVPVAFVVAVFPTLARAGHAKRETQVQRALAVTVALGAGAAAALWSLAGLLPALLGPAYAGAAGLLRLLAWNGLLAYPNYVFSNLLVIQGRQQRVLLALGLGLLGNVALNLALVPGHGASGAALATLATEALVTAVYLVSLGSAAGAWAHLSLVLRGLAAALAGLVLAWVLALLPGGAWVAPLVAGATALGLTIALGLLPLDEVRRLLRRLQGGTTAAEG